MTAAAKTTDLCLHVTHLSKFFGGFCAVQDLNFNVETGSIFSVIGPNGAGKTSLVNMISGFYEPDSGSVQFSGSDITRLRPNARTRRHITRDTALEFWLALLARPRC